MADNTTIQLPSIAGDIIATEDIGGAKLQRIKLAIGAVDVDGGDVSTTNPLPVIQAKSNIATGAAQFTISTTAAQACDVNTSRKRLIIQNTGTTTLHLTYGSDTPTTTIYHISLQSCLVANDGSGGILSDEMWIGAIQIISSDSGGTYVLTELT